MNDSYEMVLKFLVSVWLQKYVIWFVETLYCILKNGLLETIVSDFRGMSVV